MICVTGLRGYWGTELNIMILLNNQEFTYKKNFKKTYQQKKHRYLWE